jgi:cyanophycinase-like exopeptidase
MMVGIFFVGGDGERVCGMVTDGRVWKSTTALNIGRMLHTFMQRHFRGLGN